MRARHLVVFAIAPYKKDVDTARKAKDFKESDRIRDELVAMGVELEDHKDRPTTWKLKR